MNAAANTGRRPIKIELGADDQPPPEFLIFPAGDFPTLDGVFHYDPKLSAASVMRVYENHAIDLHIDFEHASEEPSGEIAEGAPAAAWFDPEARPDGLWATNIHWTPRATEYLKNKEYRYFSPVFGFDNQRRVTSLKSIGLTNTPKMSGQEPLMAARAVSFTAHPVVTGPWDANAAVGRLRKWASSDGSGDKGTIDWPKYGEGFALVRNGGDKFGDYFLPHHDVRDGKLATSKRGVEAAAEAVQGARGGIDLGDDAEAVKHHLAEHYKQWGGTPPWQTKNRIGAPVAPESTPMDEEMMKQMTAHLADHKNAVKEMLGAHEEKMKAHGEAMKDCVAKMGEHMTAMKAMPPTFPNGGKGGTQGDPGHATTPVDDMVMAKMRATSETVKRLTGQSDPDAALGALEGMTAQLRDVTKTATDAAAELKRRDTAEITALFDAAATEGRVSPAEIESLKPLFGENVARLRAYLGTRQKIGSVAAPVAQPAAGVYVLTETDRAVMKQLGIGEKEFVAETVRKAGIRA